MRSKTCGCAILVALMALAGLPSIASAATEFVCAIREDGNGDFTSLQTWQNDIRCNLRDSGTLTAEWNNLSGSLIVRNAAVTWGGGSGSGTLVHMTTVARSGKDAFLIKGASGVALAQGHVVTDGVNSFTVANTPDSVIAVARIEGTWNNPDAPLMIARYHWHGSEANPIRIYTVGEARHQGRRTETAHRLQGSGNLINNEEAWVVFDGLQLISDPSPGDSAYGFYTRRQEETNTLVFKNGLVTATDAITNSLANAYIGLRVQNADTTLKVVNTIVHLPKLPGAPGNTQNHYGLQRISGLLHTYNSVVSGFLGDGNCAAFRTIDAVYNTALVDNKINFSSMAAAAISHCASSTGTGDAAVYWQNGSADWDNVFEDWANGDFRLKDYTGVGAIIDMGMTDPGDGLYSDDIVGTARPQGNAWTIGAFEWMASTPLGPVFRIR